VEFAQQYRIDPARVRTESVRIFATHHEPEETTMTSHASHASRRGFIKITAAGLVAAPFANALLSGATQAVDAVSESEPTATALGYKMDATKASNRKDKTAVCGNCSLYSGKPGASDGPCSVFGGKLVNAKGWCTAWVKKA
jgi:High potential iron-sulfur protein